MREVWVRRRGRPILSDIDWCVATGERWVVLGPNGAGKTKLLQVASTYLGPSSGDLEVLGERYGRTDVRVLRQRIGYTSQALAVLVPPQTLAFDLVLMGTDAKLRRFNVDYTDAETDRAAALLDEVGCTSRAHDPFWRLSAGEQQRVQIARSLMGEPRLLLLDEPAAGLDIGGREYLTDLIARLAQRDDLAGLVLVTHHLEEIPSGFTHALLLREGGVVAGGPIESTLSDSAVSECFGVGLTIGRAGGRYQARVAAE